MEKTGENLPTTELRKQLISAINDFIKDLEHSSLESLVEKRMHIIEALELLHIRESKEAARLEWGRNSLGSAKVIAFSNEQDGSTEEEDDEKTEMSEGA